jgi:hypothetical protein
MACTLQFFWRFSRTSRWKLMSSSLFATRDCRCWVRQFAHRALLIVPPIVSGATPTLEAIASVGNRAPAVVSRAGAER